MCYKKSVSYSFKTFLIVVKHRNNGIQKSINKEKVIIQKRAIYRPQVVDLLKKD